MMIKPNHTLVTHTAVLCTRSPTHSVHTNFVAHKKAKNQVHCTNRNIPSNTMYEIILYISIYINKHSKSRGSLLVEVYYAHNSHIDVAEITEVVLNHMGMFLSVKHGSQKASTGSAWLSPSHSGLGRVHDRGHQTSHNVQEKQSNSQLFTQVKATQTHTDNMYCMYNTT